MANETIELDLLPRCTVRVDVAGAPKGTGFFVAPGTVVTCAHVIESQRLSPGDMDPAIEIVLSGGDVRYPMQRRSGGDWRQDDVALLQLVNSVDHPCVLLASGLLPRDPLHSFGFPDNHPEGIPTKLDADGFTGDKRLLRFTEGQVLVGMSGSPVYNARTGAVCGMVKKSTDPRSALGGYGIRVETLLQLDPRVFQIENHLYHDSNEEWLDLLTNAQRALLTPRRVGPSDDAAVTSIVSIGRAGDDWLVRASFGPDEPDLGPVRVDLNSIRTMVARLLRDWASSGRVDVGTQNQLLGEILFRAAFPGEIGDRFNELLRTKKERPVLVGLHFQGGTEKSLVTLPWEHLYVPQDEDAGMYLARESSISLVRCREDELDSTDSLQRRELSVLMVGVKPPRAVSGEEEAMFDPDDVREVTAAAEQLQKDGNGLTVDVIVADDAEKLASFIEQRDDQVIHVVSYGCFRRRVGEQQRTEEVVAKFTFDVLADCIRQGNPQLVVLQLLEAEKQRVAADFALLAPSLIATGIDHVIAYQYPVSGDTATKFNGALYKALAAGASVDEAVQQARNSVWLSDQGSRAFISPALFVARPGRRRLVAAGAAVGQRVGAFQG
jgi:CHAT domain/Trypsin-like peptidase domain